MHSRLVSGAWGYNLYPIHHIPYIRPTLLTLLAFRAQGRLGLAPRRLHLAERRGAAGNGKYSAPKAWPGDGGPW